mmetsp:Transcript_58922/g.166174  ORF Transcript_58922/g.166174 Transcript_58922/m.166174 type:complete len:240 (-) Transcript_58922:61-780(-)
MPLRFNKTSLPHENPRYIPWLSPIKAAELNNEVLDKQARLAKRSRDVEHLAGVSQGTWSHVTYGDPYGDLQRDRSNPNLRVMHFPPVDRCTDRGSHPGEPRSHRGDSEAGRGGGQQAAASLPQTPVRGAAPGPPHDAYASTRSSGSSFRSGAYVGSSSMPNLGGEPAAALASTLPSKLSPAPASQGAHHEPLPSAQGHARPPQKHASLRLLPTVMSSARSQQSGSQHTGCRRSTTLTLG